MTPTNFEDVEGRNVSFLGIAVSPKEGRYYVIPDSGMTLYVNVNNECDEVCERYYLPYELDEVSYYLFRGDKVPGEFGGDNLEGWEIARP
jgi:predicted lipoprotein with Yx(FWY)xxD motif